MLQQSSDDPFDVAQCRSAEAVERAQAFHPDALLIDGAHDFADALGVVRALGGTVEAGLMFIGSSMEVERIYEAVVAGADGYVAWDAGADALITGLRAVASGEIGLGGQVALTVIRQLRQAAHAHATRADLSVSLTPREQEIFDLVRKGLRSREIAERLCIADSTANKHIQHILEKLHVRSRTQAVVLSEAPPNERPQTLFS